MAPKAKTPKENESASYKIGDLVLGHIKGYPQWPAKVVDAEVECPSKLVMKSKPSKKNVYLLKYYTDANYSWSEPKEMVHLTTEIIEKYIASGNKKDGKLLSAYKTAQDPDSWEEKQAASSEVRRKRKESGKEETSEEESEEEEDEDDEVGKKRKRKPAKEATKKKAKTEKTRESKRSAKPASKKDAIDNFPEEGEARCKDWRHKLQKAFLTDKGLPTKEEMPGMDAIFKDMETFEVQAEWLASSKIAKVLKRIAAIPNAIAREKDFNLKGRSNDLLEKWKGLTASAGGDKMDVDEPVKKADEPVENGDKPATNGTADKNGDKTEDAVDAAVEKVVEQAKDVEEAKKDEAAEPVADA